MKPTEINDSEQIEMNVQKVKTKKKFELKIPKINGVWLLFFMNLKKTFLSKAVIAMGIISVFMTVLFITLAVNLEKSTGIGGVFSLVGFIFIMFFFIIFLTIVCISLIKVPMIEGITKIETRAGVAMWKTFTIRYATYLIVSWFYTLLSLIGILIFTSKFDLQPLAGEAYFYSPIVFLILFPIIWFPLVALVSLLFSVAAGTFMGIFLGAIVSVSPIISAMSDTLMGTTKEYDQPRTTDYGSILKFGLNYSQDFYNLLKDDKNLGKIFTDDEDGAKILGTIEDNYYNELKLTGLSPLNVNLVNEEKSEILNTYIRAMVMGQFNIDTRTAMDINNGEGETDGETDGETEWSREIPPVKKTALQGLSINDVLTKIYDKVDEYFETNQRPPMLQPGNIDGVFIQSYTNTKVYNIDKLTNWLGEKIPEYKVMLDFMNSYYQKYNDLFFARKNGKIGYFWSPLDLKTINTQVSEGVDDTRAYEIYYRYPELMVLNSMLVQSWISVFNISILDSSEVYGSYDSAEGASGSNEDTMNAVLSELNAGPRNASVDILRQFFLIFSGITSSQSGGDAYTSASVIGLRTRGLLQSIDNFEALYNFAPQYFNSASTTGTNRTMQMVPMFKQNQISTTFGYQIWLSLLVYMSISLLCTYLIYLLYGKKARI